jgi:hypothetical protein
MQKPYLAGIGAVIISFGLEQGYRLSKYRGYYEAFDAIATPNLTDLSRQITTPASQNTLFHMAGAGFENWVLFRKP